MIINPFNPVRRLLRLRWSLVLGLFIICAAALSLAPNAMGQCQWTTGTGSIFETCGNIGIGETTPNALLHISSGAAFTQHFRIFSFVGTTGGTDHVDDGRGIIALFRGRNTEASPAALINGDTIGKLVFYGYDASTTPIAQVGALIVGTVDNTVVAGSVPTALSFQTGGTAERMRITSAGNVGIGTINPASRLVVSANASSLPAPPSDTLVTFAGSDGLGVERILFDNFGGGGNFTFRMARGTAAMPTATQLNDYLGVFAGFGYGATGYSSGGRCHIRFGAAENWTDTANGTYMGFWTTPTGTLNLTEAMRIDASGRVGVGITSPVAPLHVLGINNQGLRISGGANARATFVSSDNATNLWNLDNSAGTFRIFREDYNGSGFGANGQIRMVITDAGNVGIGTTAPGSKLDISGNANVSGNLTVTGNIAAKYQDVAEWVPASQSISAGTVVVLDTSRSNLVMSSSRPYDTSVVGVVSANPGLALGESGAGKVLVATTGRVKVKVDATAAPIRVGDLLVTSDKPGVAMKSQPVDLGGVKIHRPGTLIGKALEPLDRGQGEILVLLTLQ